MSLLVQTAHKIASFSTLADGDSVLCLNDLSFATLQWFGDLFWRWGLNDSLTAVDCLSQFWVVSQC